MGNIPLISCFLWVTTPLLSPTNPTFSRKENLSTKTDSNSSPPSLFLSLTFPEKKKNVSYEGHHYLHIPKPMNPISIFILLKLSIAFNSKTTPSFLKNSSVLASIEAHSQRFLGILSWSLSMLLYVCPFISKALKNPFVPATPTCIFPSKPYPQGFGYI